MAKTDKLDKAKLVKDDEFYTLYSDVEWALLQVKEQLKNKVIYCNCDNYKISNFYLYLKNNFKELGLKKLICTHYTETSLFCDARKVAYKCVYNGNSETITALEGNSDFASYECVKLLQDSDIIITNPPFSLFREFFDLLIKNNKDFIILGSNLAVSYLDIFELFKQGKVNLINKEIGKFLRPDGTFKRACAVWYTSLNLDAKPFLKLKKDYRLRDYHYLDNTNAINVNEVKNIPDDFFEPMAVPQNIAHQLNFNQFELLALIKPKLNGKFLFNRFIIRRKENE